MDVVIPNFYRDFDKYDTIDEYGNISNDVNVLNLTFHKFGYQTVDFSKFPDLRVLDLSFNDISTFIIPETLVSLNLAHNIFREFNIIKFLPNLQKLDLSFNHLTSFKTLEENKIKYLNLSNNLISKIYLPKDLVYVDLSNNKLQEITNAIFPSKITIDVSGNPLFLENGERIIRSPDIKKVDVSLPPIATLANISQQEALRNYTKYYDMAINSNLRNEVFSKKILGYIQQIISVIDEAFDHPPVSFFRGIVGNLKVGDFFVDPGFSSKTTNYDTAKKFTQSSCCLLRLTYPEPSKQISLKDYSYYSDEEEFLSYPGESFYVEEIRKSSDGTDIYECIYVDNYYKFNFDFEASSYLDKIWNQIIKSLFFRLHQNSILLFVGKEKNFVFSPSKYIFSSRRYFYSDFNLGNMEAKCLSGNFYECRHLEISSNFSKNLSNFKSVGIIKDGIIRESSSYLYEEVLIALLENRVRIFEIESGTINFPECKLITTLKQ